MLPAGAGDVEVSDDGRDWRPVAALSGADGLTARAQVLNLDGSVVWGTRAALDSPYDSTLSPFSMEYPEGLTAVHFLRLRLGRGGESISENFYWRGTEPANYRALRTLPKVSLRATTRSQREGDRHLLLTELENRSRAPALGLRLVAVRAETGDRILPALYRDNFVALMPGEMRVIDTELLAVDARGEEPRIVVEGFNVASGDWLSS